MSLLWHYGRHSITWHYSKNWHYCWCLDLANFFYRYIVSNDDGLSIKIERQLIPPGRMFIHSPLSPADTNQPIVYSKGLGKQKNWWPGQEKTISFDVFPQVSWWCKVTHQTGGVRTNPSNPPWIPPCGLPDTKKISRAALTSQT